MVLFYFFLCLAVGYFAYKKGRSGIGFFIISIFLTPIIGLIVVLLVKPDQQTTDAMAIEDGTLRKCPYCAEIVKTEALICKHCHSELSPVGIKEKIIPLDPYKKF